MKTVSEALACATRRDRPAVTFPAAAENCQCTLAVLLHVRCAVNKCVKAKGKGSPYSITERRAPQLNPVLGSQPAVT